MQSAKNLVQSKTISLDLVLEIFKFFTRKTKPNLHLYRL